MQCLKKEWVVHESNEVCSTCTCMVIVMNVTIEIPLKIWIKYLNGKISVIWQVELKLVCISFQSIQHEDNINIYRVTLCQIVSCDLYNRKIRSECM